MFEDEGLDSAMEDRLSGNDTLMGQDCSEFDDDVVPPDEPCDGLTDVEADAQTLAMCGWGTDEDYGHFHDNCDDWGE